MEVVASDVISFSQVIDLFSYNNEGCTKKRERLWQDVRNIAEVVRGNCVETSPGAQS